MRLLRFGPYSKSIGGVMHAMFGGSGGPVSADGKGAKAIVDDVRPDRLAPRGEVKLIRRHQRIGDREQRIGGGGAIDDINARCGAAVAIVAERSRAVGRQDPGIPVLARRVVHAVLVIVAFGIVSSTMPLPAAL